MHIIIALIVAAGSGSRLGGGLPKQYRTIGGKAVLAHAVDALASHPGIDAVRVVIGEGQEKMARAALGPRDVGDLIVGGATRSDCVCAGLASNLAALRALSCEGIQRGHMGLHARQIAMSAGAPPALVEHVAEQLITERCIKPARAQEIVDELLLNLEYTSQKAKVAVG